MSTHICPNCNNEFTGQFCNGCGQKLSHRITMAHIGHDLVHAFTHADKGFFYLMLELFRNPGKVAREYIIEHKRKRYFTPFQYIIIIGTIATFIVSSTHFMETMMSTMSFGQEYSTRQAVIMQKISQLQTRYYNIMILLQLPFLSLSTLWLYKKHKLNYAEHLTLHTFITAQTTLISMFLMLFMFILDRSNLNILSSFLIVVGSVSLLYHLIVYMQFFEQKTFKGFFKALAAYILGLIIFTAFTMIISTIIGIIYAAIYKY